jgi:tRNA threonylcarbamoyladenosine biosynthesis protein TsaB
LAGRLFSFLRRYALGVSDLGRERLLLIDTCGETAGVAVCAMGRVLGLEEFAPGRASAEIVAAVRRLLKAAGWGMEELDAVGVVSGPGSFTGVRTGLAAAKGLCEGADVRLVAVSRLAVLAESAGVSEGLVVLEAGRGELYVREVQTGREWVCGDADLMALLSERQAQNALGKDKQSDNGRGKGIVVAEERVAERLAGAEVLMRGLHVGDALVVVRRELAAPREGQVIDANYVRGEQDIYRKAGEPMKAVATAD